MSSELIQITSGRGPVECAWVAAQLLEALLAEARGAQLDAEVIEAEPGPDAGTLRSALIHLSGDDCAAFAAALEGTVQWIGTSRFRPQNRRRNWFVGVRRVPVPVAPVFSERDVRIEVMRASGPGGQHVNTTESAVRAVHLPTGLAAIAREERSQFANRKRALERLAILVARSGERALDVARQQRWAGHDQLERGNPIRVYEGDDFRRRRGEEP